MIYNDLRNYTYLQPYFYGKTFGDVRNNTIFAARNY